MFSKPALLLLLVCSFLLFECQAFQNDRRVLTKLRPRMLFATTPKDDKNEKVVLDATRIVIRRVLDSLRDSDFIQLKHQEHVNSTTVTHLFKNTPLARMPDTLKLSFVDSWAGKALATVMAEEQIHLGDWKLEKIVEAAGEYDTKNIQNMIQDTVKSSPVVMYSFVDCPWCIAAKDLLQKEYANVSCKIIELEELGRIGKAIRAELAKETGRTSMPCIFVNSQPIGGFSDGTPCGPGLQQLHESTELRRMLENQS